jgi:hypothetical protein
MLKIAIPESYLPEREYVLHVIFFEFLCLPYLLRVGEAGRVVIAGPGDRRLIVADDLFARKESDWLTSKCMPRQNLLWCHVPDCFSSDLVDKIIPVLFGVRLSSGQFFDFADDHIDCGIDIFGSVFFFLSRYEEVVVRERDEHDRFPDSAALAFREGFLERPIVDEYVAILRSMLKALWPTLPSPEPKPRMFLTHDVDRPFLFYGAKFGRLLRRMGGDAVTRRSLRSIPKTIGHWRSVRTHGYVADPFYTFEWIMDVSDKHGVRSAFNFIVDRTNYHMDGEYSLDEPEIRALIRRIGQRGHEIGLHPSYNSYRDGKQTALEFEKLKRVCHEENVDQSAWGGRQHYLRWAGPETFQNWEDAGLSYDSTLGFSKAAGFRCGTSHEYSVFNLLTRTGLRLKERPMIVMDAAILSENDNVATAHQQLQNIEILCKRCSQFGGTMTLLVHNNSLYLDSWIDIYEAVLECIH